MSGDKPHLRRCRPTSIWPLIGPVFTSAGPYSRILNMDSVFALPQLSATNFSYTRLPHVSHGVFCAGPIGGTFAVPQNPSDQLIAHLRGQHLAQSMLYGSAPSAVAHTPPPPGRARSQARAVSRARAAPVDPPARRQFNPNGPAAYQFLADSRAARIRGERAARPAPTLQEQQAAREERARRRSAAAADEAAIQRDLDDFMSTASVYTSDEVRIRHF